MITNKQMREFFGRPDLPNKMELKTFLAEWGETQLLFTSLIECYFQDKSYETEWHEIRSGLRNIPVKYKYESLIKLDRPFDC